MLQFTHPPPGAFADLRQRTTGKCVVFFNQPMPPGVSRPTARIGVEISPNSEQTLLYVDRGMSYSGDLADIARWVATGTLEFDSFEAFERWCAGPLRQAFGAGEVNEPMLVSTIPPKQAATVQADIDAVMGAVTNDARFDFRAIEPDALLAELQTRVKGQEPALRAMARRICNHLAQRNPRRPATLLAIGRTGVGKTLAVETLPEALAALDPRANRLGVLRLNMTEYQEAHRISQLIGSPQGYIGHGDGAQLLDALAANPRTIVLFDEIDKAHPDVFKVLMNAMDAGLLSSAARVGGRHEVDCRQSIFMFTSNLRAEEIGRDLERGNGYESRAEVDRVCRAHLQAAGMPVELIGRISEFLAFQPLAPRARAEVMMLAIQHCSAQYGLTVEFIEPEVIARLMDEARDGDYGARPAEYVVDSILGDTLARASRAGVSGSIRIKGWPPAIYPADKVAEDTPAPSVSS